MLYAVFDATEFEDIEELIEWTRRGETSVSEGSVPRRTVFFPTGDFDAEITTHKVKDVVHPESGWIALAPSTRHKDLPRLTDSFDVDHDFVVDSTKGDGFTTRVLKGTGSYSVTVTTFW